MGAVAIDSPLDWCSRSPGIEEVPLAAQDPPQCAHRPTGPASASDSRGAHDSTRLPGAEGRREREMPTGRYGMLECAPNEKSAFGGIAALVQKEINARHPPYPFKQAAEHLRGPGILLRDAYPVRVVPPG